MKNERILTDPVRSCIAFLRMWAEMLEKGDGMDEAYGAPAQGDDDPVGVLVFTKDGPRLYVPNEYVDATEDKLQDEIDTLEVLGYGRGVVVSCRSVPS